MNLRECEAVSQSRTERSGARPTTLAGNSCEYPQCIFQTSFYPTGVPEIPNHAYCILIPHGKKFRHEKNGTEVGIADEQGSQRCKDGHPASNSGDTLLNSFECNLFQFF